MNAVEDADHLANLAAEDLQANRIGDAEAKCLRILGADRLHRGALSVLGMVLHAQGRHEDAVRVFHALTQYEPLNPRHWENLGTALRPTRRVEAAIQAYDRAVELGGASADLLYGVAALHVDRCEYATACALFERAVRLAPTDAGLRLAYAQCSFEALRPEEAAAILEGWQQFEKLTPEVLAGIAHLLVMTGNVRRAEPALAQVLESSRRAERTSLRVVRVLERLNRLAEARSVLRVIKADSRTDLADPDLLLAEALLAQRERAHEDASRLLLSVADHEDDFLRRHHMLFPLAKSLDALGRYEEAYAMLEEAHRSQTEFLATAYGKQATESSPAIQLARESSEPRDIETWADSNAPGTADSPIFIVAFPRSGTTLLEQILDAHPGVRSMDETPFLKYALDDARNCGIHYPRELGKLSDSQLEEIRTRYWARVRERVELSAGQRLVDKNPLNMMRLPLIQRLFPQARTVLAVRHPCDIVLSCYQQQFRAPDLALICRDLPTLAHNFATAFDYWYSQVPLLGAATRELRYESLVDDLAGEVQRLAEFLQLPWDEAMLAPAAHARAKGYISTPSYSQVIEPVNRKSVGRWKHYERHFAAVLPRLMPFLTRWGYAL